MPEGANKGASELAKELAAKLDVTNNESDNLTKGERNLAKALKEHEENEAKKVATPIDEVATPDGKVLIRQYKVLVDAIAGASPKVEEQNISTLKGIVTDADLTAAGVDKAWLLRIGSIEDLGYREA